MARQLRADHDLAVQLILIDSHPPGADDGYLDSRDLIEAQLSCAPFVVPLGAWIEELASMPPSAQASAICRRIDWRGADSAARTSVELTLRDVLTCNAAKNRYRPPGTLDIPVHLMRIDDEAFHRDRNAIEHLGWQQLFASRVAVSWLTGAHLDLFAAARIGAIARRLESILDLHS